MTGLHNKKLTMTSDLLNKKLGLMSSNPRNIHYSEENKRR